LVVHAKRRRKATLFEVLTIVLNNFYQEAECTNVNESGSGTIDR
jgi:hypothetical protein